MMQKYFEQGIGKQIAFKYDNLTCGGKFVEFNLQEGWIRVDYSYGFPPYKFSMDKKYEFKDQDRIFNLIYIHHIHISELYYIKCIRCDYDTVYENPVYCFNCNSRLKIDGDN